MIAIKMRRLTAREHYLCALVLCWMMTFMLADMAVPFGLKMANAGHPAGARLEFAMPVAMFVVSLVVLLPRTGNQSCLDLFRFVGRFPLMLRYLVVD